MVAIMVIRCVTLEGDYTSLNHIPLWALEENRVTELTKDPNDLQHTQE